MAATNPCARTVTPEHAYEVLQVANHPMYRGIWTWYVLKKYQTPQREADNSYARWFCWVTSPSVSERGEYGDVYVADIIAIVAQHIPNPLTHQDEQTRKGETHEVREA